MEDIRNFSYQELKSLLEKEGHKEYRIKQLFKWLYAKGCHDFTLMTDLSKRFREELHNRFSINKIELIECQKSIDGTQKFLFKTAGDDLIESVLIPDENRYTLCVSSQIGCAMDCKFCNTGDRGFERNLETWEILEQLLQVIEKTNIKPNNIVFMGMGEPLANYDNVVRAIRIMQDSAGFNYSPRKITLSTSGVADKIIKLGTDVVVKLAVSLNATTDEVRNKIMPVNKKYPIDVLLKALKRYPLPKNSEITIEYVLIDGVNDSLEDAMRLCDILKGIKTKINLILFNSWGEKRFKPPAMNKVLAFQQILWDCNMRVLIRESKGSDILAACGQLRGKYQNL
ncbi:MAG: 23S rRNA (adenine(2503)-C(2))-methyltransferase RlmN [bacterium]